MKKLIFIGGTSRSGSTLLDMILSNDANAMSLGEIHALFRPTRKHHFTELKKIKNDPVWSIIINGGKRKLYPNLIKYFPHIYIFVDSSKDPCWFKYHEKVKKNTYHIEHCLIYKSPEELAKSFIKRGKRDAWIRTYINYHKKYFSLINNFITIPYKDLILNDNSLKKLCERIDIDYFPDKKKYWNKNYNTFFGSNSVKSVNAFEVSMQQKRQNRKDLSYDAPDEKITNFVKLVTEKKKILNNIYRVLNIKNVTNNSNVISQIPSKYKYNGLIMQLIKIKQTIMRRYRKFILTIFRKSQNLDK